MTQHDSPDPPDESQREATAEAVADYSSRIADLYASLNDLPSVATAGADAPAIEAKRAALGAEIRRLVAEMNDLRRRTGHWHEKPAGPDTEARRQLDADILRLRKDLGRVADAQIALVADWNANPSDERREVFEQEYRRLADEYSSVRAKLGELRGKRGGA